jgi:putative hemolysin
MRQAEQNRESKPSSARQAEKGIASKASTFSMERGMMPRSSPTPLPCMVCVLPEPVCPYLVNKKNSLVLCGVE